MEPYGVCLQLKVGGLKRLGCRALVLRDRRRGSAGPKGWCWREGPGGLFLLGFGFARHYLDRECAFVALATEVVPVVEGLEGLPETVGGD